MVWETISLFYCLRNDPDKYKTGQLRGLTGFLYIAFNNIKKASNKKNKLF